MLEKCRSTEEPLQKERYRCAVILKVFCCIKFDEAKVRELWTELQEKKCFQGSKPLWRQRRVIANKGYVVNTLSSGSVYASLSRKLRETVVWLSSSRKNKTPTNPRVLCFRFNAERRCLRKTLLQGCRDRQTDSRAISIWRPSLDSEKCWIFSPSLIKWH